MWKLRIWGGYVLYTSFHYFSRHLVVDRLCKIVFISIFIPLLLLKDIELVATISDYPIINELYVYIPTVESTLHGSLVQAFRCVEQFGKGVLNIRAECSKSIFTV